MLNQPASESGVPRRVLRQHLRDLRNQAGLTVKVAAGLLEWSEPKLWQIESGQNALRALDVEAMCTGIDAPPGLTQALAEPTRQTRAHGWWRLYRQAIPEDLSIYAALEDAACSLAGYAPSQVPPLLRTEDYARTVITSTGLGSGEVDPLVYDCMIRRARITRTRAPVSVTIALTRPCCTAPSAARA